MMGPVRRDEIMRFSSSRDRFGVRRGVVVVVVRGDLGRVGPLREVTPPLVLVLVLPLPLPPEPGVFLTAAMIRRREVGVPSVPLLLLLL
jgi:hypothetical protein